MWRDPHSEELIVEPVVTAPAPETPVVSAPVIRDRRRPGRPATVNPHLIPLLRAPAKVNPHLIPPPGEPAKVEEAAKRPNLPPPIRDIGFRDAVLLLLPFWTTCGVIFWLGW